ncbi:hypothetical protein VSR01_20800 [Actinacidiphila sp. DG2A-62]|uniref:hypothetical protein n=1 Tax=Actinacidiphila sp. DG2A-62 TaxID=3108821 RepID=UPI002DBC7F7B|nr:hypothetical protein [Actinacidiphila sp. DG2A-62]MEC3995823.1 hypothetical protein [Actinacidiphila sp. DG2A-62]
MRISRTRRRALIGTTAVSLSAALGVALAPAASADSTPGSVYNVVTQDDGTVTVYITGEVATGSLRLSVRASTAADAPVLAVVDGFTAGHTNDAVRLPAGTAYGDYPVDVDWQLGDGTQEHAGDAGTLDYRKHASIPNVTADRTVTDFTHRSVTLGGHVDVLDPATGVTAPAPAATPVKLTWWDDVAPGSRVQHTQTVATDDAGTFTLPVTPGGTLESGTAQVVAGDDIAPAISPAAVPTVQAQSETYQITASSTPASVHKGQSITVKGKVTRYDAATGGYVPFAGAPVVTTSVEPDYYGYTVPHRLAGTTTAADGSFSYSITANMTTTLHTYVAPSPYLPNIQEVQSTVTVPVATSVTLPAFSLDQYGTVKTTGRLTGAQCGNQSLWLQYSPNGRSNWLNLSHITTGYGNGSYCSFVMQAYGYIDGYYRVVHFESPQLLAYTEPAHRLRRTDTQMSIAASTTRPASATSKVTFSGVVIARVSSGWVHYNHAHVVLVYRPKGDSQWYWVQKGYTNSAGRYTFTTPAYGDGTWAAYLDADSTHFASETKDVYVDVR